MKNPLNKFNITLREQEIILFLSFGYSTREIAKQLFISNETVKSHRKNIILKTQARNTANLIKIACENKLCDFNKTIQLKSA